MLVSNQSSVGLCGILGNDFRVVQSIAVFLEEGQVKPLRVMLCRGYLDP